MLTEQQEKIVYYAKIDIRDAEPAERTRKLYGKTCKLAETGLGLEEIKDALRPIIVELEIPASLATNSVEAAFKRITDEGKAGSTAEAEKPEAGDAVPF